MKIRNGFVSNSSSSSFILIAEKNEQIKVPVSFVIDILENTDGVEILKTLKEVELLIQDYGWDYVDDREEEKEKMRKAIADGKVVVVLDIDNCSSKYDLVCEAIKVLEKETNQVVSTEL